MALTAQNLSAQAIWDHIAATKRSEEEARIAAEAAQKAELAKLRESFEQREIQPEALERIATLIRRAVERGEKEALVLQFPSEWLPDQGRAVTSHDPEWHRRLEGFPRRAYDLFEKELAPRGFQLGARILDFPGGMPGDVGWFLSWKHPDEM